jgi:predicted  nucleic acid-binding Zn-ribbon protein
VSDLTQLLTVQAHDTTTDQLRHRLANLPERAELNAVVEAIAAIDAELAGTVARLGDLERSQRRLEDEIESLVAKSVAVDRTLYSGRVNAPRELTAMQEELAALGRRRSHLEDQVIEIMEEREPLDAAVETANRQRAELAARSETLRAAAAEAERAVEAELAVEAAARAAAAADVPDALLADYERLRARLGGVAAAPLQGRSCGGCHLTLSAVELDRLRRLPPDAVVHREECGRILVR